MTVRELTDEDVAEIRTRYQQGQSAYALARRFKVHEASIRRILDEAGIERRAIVARVPESDEVIIGLVEKDGYTWVDLGRRLGISRGGALQRYRRARRRVGPRTDGDQAVRSGQQ